jgi:hypothetical protein
VAGSLQSSDDASSRQAPHNVAPYNALENVPGDGIMFGASSTNMRDIRDGTSTTVMVGETYTDTYAKDGQEMDVWAMFSPQFSSTTATWRPGAATGTEHTECAGSTLYPINSRLNPAMHGVQMEISFGSYHVGGAHFTMADGAVKFLSENIDLTLYQALGSRNGKEVIGDF